MGDTTRWLLPNGIDELLPEQAGRVEDCRRLLLNTCSSWGYEYIVPPLVEFTDSLHVGLGLTSNCSVANSLITRPVKPLLSGLTSPLRLHELMLTVWGSRCEPTLLRGIDP